MNIEVLLEARVEALERFLEVSERFQMEYQPGNLQRMSWLEEEREKHVRAIVDLGKRLEAGLSAHHAGASDSATAGRIEVILERTKELQVLIQECDKRLLILIDQEQGRIMEEINAQRRNQATLSKFKSEQSSARTGAGLDERL